MKVAITVRAIISQTPGALEPSTNIASNKPAAVLYGMALVVLTDPTLIVSTSRIVLLGEGDNTSSKASCDGISSHVIDAFSRN